MNRKSLLILVMAALCAPPASVSAQEASLILHPEWGWSETGLFLGAFAGYSGACACTVYVALPILMDLFWYPSTQSAGDPFATRLAHCMEEHIAANTGVLISDAVCISAAILCNVMLSLRLGKARAPDAGPGRMSVSVMGVAVGRF
jgi:hypothetical protein